MELTNSNLVTGQTNTWRAEISFSLGCLLGFGTFAYTFSTVDLVLAAIATFLLLRNYRPPGWTFLLLGSIWIFSINGANPVLSLSWGGRIWILAFICSWAATRTKPEYIALGFTTALTLQTLGAVPHLFDTTRGWVGLSWNLSVLSHSGLAMLLMTTKIRSFTFISAVLTLVAAGARAPVGAVVLWAILRPNRASVVAVLLVLALFTYNHNERLDPGVISNAFDTRAELLGEYDPWRPAGFAAYNYAAPPPKPHNIFVLLFYELGVFVVVPIALAIYAWRQGIIPWQLLVVYGAYGLFVEAPVGRADGHFTLAAVLTYFAAKVHAP